MTINLKEALARLRAEKGNISVDGLRALIAQIDVVSTGSPTVLFSGNFSASAEFLSLVDDIHRSGADIRSVRSTAIAAFLDVRNNTDLTEVLTRLFGDSPLVEGSASYQFLGGQTGPNGRIANGIWDEISRRFARATSGDVRVLTSVDAVDGVFAKTELPELLKNPNVTTIEGIPRKQLLAMKERLGDAGLEGFDISLRWSRVPTSVSAVSRRVTWSTISAITWRTWTTWFPIRKKQAWSATPWGASSMTLAS